MNLVSSKRLAWILVAGALLSWLLHFYAQLERASVGWFEAAFGGWAMLPLSVCAAASVLIARIRNRTVADDPQGFYERGAGRYLLVAMTAAASLGLVFLGARTYL